MNTTHRIHFAKAAVLAAALSFSANLRAETSGTAPAVGGPVASQSPFQTVGFSDSAEAGMLQNAYTILATGDHDYRGHRVKAMHQVKAAAVLLGLDLGGDDRYRQKQFLSDDKLREAQGLITQVLGAAEVKGQPRVVKHLNNAINQINTALSIR